MSAPASTAQFPSFPDFFRALWGKGRDPFPWQTMLAERVLAKGWPDVVDLPTAAGKTACIDVGVYSLAAQAAADPRAAPRRIWWVVDRRIVVDEAFNRARAICDRLEQAIKGVPGPLRAVAERLRELAGAAKPLLASRLRGGAPLEGPFAALPAQPAVIATTVDQLGSRLLFRAYGCGANLAPIAAGLAANDSLILLDEAHLSCAFEQTLRSIATFRAWGSTAGLSAPFAFVTLSATAAPGAGARVFPPESERAQSLDCEILRARCNASKPARLITARGGALDEVAAEEARSFVEQGRLRVGIIVNRVATALAIAQRLRAPRAQGEHPHDTLLLTGRLRPLDRDALLERWLEFLRADEPRQPERPVVTVATQCLEVGADISFDALITECASLDALRQRAGRLNRMGRTATAPAVVVAREADVNPKQPDPIYGPALPNTWKVLLDHAQETGKGKKAARAVDLSVASMEKLWAALDEAERAALLPPRFEPPVLLPAHLDLLCQTAPPAEPAPEIGLYLHGLGRGAPEVEVVWRADLDDAPQELWAEIVSLTRPMSLEAVAAPIWRVRRWLADRGDHDESDMEAEAEPAADGTTNISPCLVWRGEGHSEVASRADQITPGCTIVLPLRYGLSGLAQPLTDEERESTGQPPDLWELANFKSGRRRPALRLTRATLQPWAHVPEICQLAAAPAAPDAEGLDIPALLTSASNAGGLPGWLADLLRTLAPSAQLAAFWRGLLALGSRPKHADPIGDAFAEALDLLAARDSVSLQSHTEAVAHFAGKYADLCFPAFRPTFEAAARWHDVGKLDLRFQSLLQEGAGDCDGKPLAKSPGIQASAAERAAQWRRSGLPKNFRHEVLSSQIAETSPPTSDAEVDRDLLLHLVATHHGFCRPFPPVCLDPEPPPLGGPFPANLAIDVKDLRLGAVPAHRLDSGFADRFWRLVRNLGWWRLAYLEAVFRLADWAGSRWQLDEVEDERER